MPELERGEPEEVALENALRKARSVRDARPTAAGEAVLGVDTLVALGQEELEAGVVDATLGSVLKYHEDLERVRDRGLQELVAEAKRRADG